MTKKIIGYATLFVLSCFMTNCATIIHGSKQNIIIVSDPNKASIKLDGWNIGQTPYQARVTRLKEHTVKIEVEGYAPYEITLKRQLNGWLFGNILLGGLIGVVVDVVTGAMYSLSPTDISAELKSASTSLNKTKDEIYLAVVLKPAASWVKIGQLEKVR